MFRSKSNIAWRTMAGLLLGAGIYFLTPLHYMNARFSFDEPQSQKPAIVETKRQERLTPEQAYPLIINEFNEASLVYGKLLGRLPPKEERNSVKNPENLPFYDDRGDFLRYNEELPASITFRSADGSKGFQIAYSEAFVPGAFVWLSKYDERDVCAPPSEEKEAAYRKLAEDFEQGKAVDKSLLNIIMRASTADCTYFVEKYDPNSEKETEKRAQRAYLNSQRARSRILSGLEGVVLAYGSLQGDQFYKDKGEFLKNNERGEPYSLVFSDPNKNGGYQLAFSEPFIRSDVFVFMSGSSYFCTAPDEMKIRAWQKLVEGFENRKPVDMSLVYSIINDEIVSCSRGVG